MASRRIEVEIIGSPASLKAALGASEAGLSDFEKRTKALSRSMISTGRTMSRNVTLPIVAAGAASIKFAMNYDTAITHVQALTGASAKQTEEWSNQLLKLGPAIGQTPQQLADALYFVASSGAKVNQVLPITVASAKDAAAGMGEATTVAELLTSAVNAYGPKALSAAKASDILTASIKVGKAEPDELAASIGRAIPLAESLGVTFAETAASVAELTNTGLNADEAVTGVRAVLASLVKPAAQSKDELKKLGMTTDELRQSVRERGLNVTLQDLAKKLGDNKEATSKLFPNLRALTAFLALTGANADKVTSAVDQVTHSTGAASKAFKIASEGPQAKFNRQLAQLEATAIKIGNDLLPVFLDVAGTVADLANSFDHLSDEEKHAIEIGLGIAALSGPLLTVGGNVVRLIGLFGKLGKVAGMGGAAGGMAQAETAAAGAGAGAGIAAAGFGALAVIAGGGLLLSLKNVLDEIDANRKGIDPVTEATRKYAAQQLALTGANSQVTQSIREGGKSAAGWRQIMEQAGVTVHNASKKLHNEFYYSSGESAKFLRGAMHQSMQNFIGQLHGVAQGAEAASHDTAHFGKAARAEYAHIAATARVTAQLAAAMNAVPDQKYVQLVISVIANLKTEALAPGMGPESTRVGPGGGYSPKPPKGPPSGTGQWSGGPLIAGRDYIVGERGAERFRPGANGYLSAAHMAGVDDRGGAVAIVIENWHEGRGTMRRVSAGAVSAAAMRNRQLERMGSES